MDARIAKRDKVIWGIAGAYIVLTLLSFFFYTPEEGEIVWLKLVWCLAPYLMLCGLTFIDMSEGQSMLFFIGAIVMGVVVLKPFMDWAILGENPFGLDLTTLALWQWAVVGMMFILLKAHGTMGREE